MSLDGSAVEAIISNAAKPMLVPVLSASVTMVPPGWTELKPYRPTVPTLTVHTLDAVVDYLKYCVPHDRSAAVSPPVVHIVNPTTVRVLGPLGDEAHNFVRPVYLQADAAPCEFLFGAWHDSETAMIGLMTKFVESETQKALVALLASIRENSVRETLDSGVAQEVIKRDGVTLAERAVVPSPMLLAPYRTFREVEQPASLFVVRLKAAPSGDRPQIALFESDGYKWKLDAMKAIEEYLVGKVSDVFILG